MDALQQAWAAARTKVNAEAGSYQLPAAARTRSEAIMALILLLRSAQSDDPTNAAWYRTRAQSAAYTFQNAGITNILQTAVDWTKSAPRTGQVAKDVFNASRNASLPAKRVPRRGAASAPEAPSLPAEAPAVGFDWRTPPTWVKVTGGVVLAALAAWAFWPVKRKEG